MGIFQGEVAQAGERCSKGHREGCGFFLEMELTAEFKTCAKVGWRSEPRLPKALIPQGKPLRAASERELY